MALGIVAASQRHLCPLAKGNVVFIADESTIVSALLNHTRTQGSDLHNLAQAGGLDISAIRIMGLLVEMVVLGIMLIGVTVAVGSVSIAARQATSILVKPLLTAQDTIQDRGGVHSCKSQPRGVEHWRRSLRSL